MTQFISFSTKSVDQDFLNIEKDDKRIRYGKVAQLALLTIGAITLGSLAFLSLGSVNAHTLHTISNDAILPMTLMATAGVITTKKLTRHFKSHQQELREGLTGERLLEAMLSEAQVIRMSNPQEFLSKFSPETPLTQKQELSVLTSKLNREEWGKLIRAANEYFKDKPALQKFEKDVLQQITNQSFRVSDLLLTLDAGFIFHLIDQMGDVKKENLKLSLTNQLNKIRESYIYKQDKKESIKAFRKALIKCFGDKEKIQGGIDILKKLKTILANVDSFVFEKGAFEELIGQLNTDWTNRKPYFRIKSA